MSLKDKELDEIEPEVQSNADDVGPGQPPKKHQFKKGKSGNPKGRPKKPPRRHELLCAELMKPVWIEKGGKRVRMRRIDVIFQRLWALAVSGEPRALKLALEYVDQARLRKRNFQPEEEEPVDYSMTPELEKLFQQIESICPEEADAESTADENTTVETTSPDDVPEVHSPVTSDLNSSQENTSLSKASGSKSANPDSATAPDESTNDEEPTNQESSNASLESSTTVATKLKENDHA